MKFLKNPAVAVLLALLIVLGSTLINVHWKFGGLCRDVRDTFYSPDGIAEQVASIRVDALSLASVAERYGFDTEDLTSAATDLQNVLSQENIGAGRIFRYYDSLRTELLSTEQKLLGVALNETDAETVSNCLSRIHESSSLISSDPYNQMVRSFLAKYDHFPTHMLARLADVDLPEVFA